MSVPPALPGLAALTRGQSPEVPAHLPLDPAAELYKTPLAALEQRWGPGISPGKPAQRDWQQSWFGVDGVAASYRFTPDGRLQGIALGLFLPPDVRDGPDGAAKQQATQALRERCAALTANLFQDLGEPTEGGPSPQQFNSDTYQVWRRETVVFRLEDYAPGIDLWVSRQPLLASETVAVTGVGTLSRIALGTLWEDCSGGESELVLDTSAAGVVAARLGAVCATPQEVDLAVPPDHFRITVDDRAPQPRVVLRNLRDPAAVAGGAYGLSGMSVATARTLAAALLAPAPPRAPAGDLPALVGSALALLAERLQRPLINGYAKQFLGGINQRLLAVQQTVATGAQPDAGLLTGLTQSIAAARKDGRLDPPLSAVLFDLACALRR